MRTFKTSPFFTFVKVWFFFLNYSDRLMDFFPAKKQTEEYLRSIFVGKELSEVVKLHKAQASYEAKRELTQVRSLLF